MRARGIMKKHKILIIKVGYSETLASEISNITSYGDVLRSTVLLNLYKNDHVTWLVDEKAYPVLKNNPYINRILRYDITSVLQLQSEHFDTVINLEKVPGLCALSDKITAWRRYGFRFDVKLGEAEAYDGTQNALKVCNSEKKKKNHNKYWQEHLFEIVGEKWNGEEYILGYKPKCEEKFDIGFNYQVGNKWPLKAWPEAYWKDLEKKIDGKYTISWQQGLNNMEDYFEWINSCKMLVTNDSFGMHVAIALKKKVVAMFGPTNHRENYMYDLGTCFYPNHGFYCDKFPCMESKCLKCKDTCLELIKPSEVFDEVQRIMTETSMKEKIA